MALSQAEVYQHLSVGEFFPTDVQCRYRYIQSSDTVKLYFRKVYLFKSLLPQYHTRVMRKALLSKYGCITSKVHPALLRHRDLTGDCSSASNLSEKLIDHVAHNWT